MPSPRGAPVVRLLDLREVQYGWELSTYRIYQAVGTGKLRRYGRPDRQAYYAYDQLVDVFGTPGRDPLDAGKVCNSHRAA
jgi:hypothetical protein